LHFSKGPFSEMQYPTGMAGLAVPVHKSGEDKWLNATSPTFG